MKKIAILAFLTALSVSAFAQAGATPPNATGHTVGPVAHPAPRATNSTVNVPPVAKVAPVATRGGKK